MERRDAVAGLAQIYWRHYVNWSHRGVQAGGHDCPIKVVADALRESCQGVYNDADDDNAGGRSMRTGGKPSPRVTKGGDRSKKVSFPRLASGRSFRPP